MRTRAFQYVLLTALVLIVACRDSDREPIHTLELGKDTMFALPPEYSGQNTTLRFLDIDGDGWRDAVLLVPSAPVQRGGGADSLIFFRFVPKDGKHQRIGAYGDFGIVNVSTIQHRTFPGPLVLVWLDGGGNDALTFGKVVLVVQHDTLRKIAEAPWGDPQLIEIDSLLALEIHQSFSGTLPHAMALEYADSIIVIKGTNSQPADEKMLDRRIAYYRYALDSLWQIRTQLTADQWGDVTSKIMSLANLLSKRHGIISARSTLLQQQRQWGLLLPRPYRQLLKDFADELGDDFSFIR